jgi:hypothetical protein
VYLGQVIDRWQFSEGIAEELQAFLKHESPCFLAQAVSRIFAKVVCRSPWEWAPWPAGASCIGMQVLFSLGALRQDSGFGLHPVPHIKGQFPLTTPSLPISIVTRKPWPPSAMWMGICSETWLKRPGKGFSLYLLFTGREDICCNCWRGGEVYS